MNWMRRALQATAAAKAFTRVVLATPGTPRAARDPGRAAPQDPLERAASCRCTSARPPAGAARSAPWPRRSRRRCGAHERAASARIARPSGTPPPPLCRPPVSSHPHVRTAPSSRSFPFRNRSRRSTASASLPSSPLALRRQDQPLGARHLLEPQAEGQLSSSALFSSIIARTRDVSGAIKTAACPAAPPCATRPVGRTKRGSFGLCVRPARDPTHSTSASPASTAPA